jgi:hypothetical protein
VEKGYIKVGNRHIQDLEKTDDLTWIGQGILIQGTTVNAPATGVVWADITIYLAENNRSFDIYRRYSPYTKIATYRRI